MEIQSWWSGDQDERFWMEITGRPDLGADLFAPQADQAGKPYWGYELVTWVRPGDIVFHWHKSLLGSPAIVGASVASGRVEDTVTDWRARGTSGRARGPVGSRAAWRMPLSNYTPLEKPILEAQIREAEQALREVQAQLSDRLGSSNVPYFPFAFSDHRPIRASQTYLVKVPRAVVDALKIEVPEADQPIDANVPARPTRRKSGVGYLTDSQVRAAIERRAVELAVAHYEHLGSVEYVGESRPYDLVVDREGSELRVEVKGTSGYAEHVELTHGEVRNGREWAHTELFLAEGIEWERQPDGSVSAHGGDAMVWEEWTPVRARLKPTKYRYKLDRVGARPLGTDS